MRFALSWERAGAAALGAAAVGLLGAWGALSSQRTQSLEARVEQAIVRRDAWVSPQEVLGLLHDRRVPIELFDLRDEAAFNRFHIADACRLGASGLEPVRALPATTVKVLVAEDESRAVEAYRQLVLGGTTAMYLLEGGTNGWLAAFTAASCRDSPTCRQGLALGDRHPASSPPADAAGSYIPKVKVAAGRKSGGGCGG
jgi:rhodanese-related sulfurtransferase